MNRAMNPEDLALLDDLRTMWEAVDPAPADLADRMIATVFGTDPVDLDLELLGLLAFETELTGARNGKADSARDTTSKLEFRGGETELVLLIGPERAGKRRLDGWVLPVSELNLSLEVDDRPAQVITCTDGRFTFGPLAPGLARLIVRPTDPSTKPFQTPVFEI